MTKSPCPIVKSQEELIQVNLVFFKVGSASTVPQEEISKEQIKERKTPKSHVLSNPSGGAAFAFVCVSLRLSLVFVDSGGTTTRNCFDQNGVLWVVEASLVALRRSVEHIGISQVPQSLPARRPPSQAFKTDLVVGSLSLKVSHWCFTQAILAMPVIQTDPQADGEVF